MGQYLHKAGMATMARMIGTLDVSASWLNGTCYIPVQVC